jgi:hypothetical protein
MSWGNGLGNHNYCRNPSGDVSGKFKQPWCLTLDGKEEACNVEECGRHFHQEADAVTREMKATDCKCAEHHYGSAKVFLEQVQMGQTKDGRPCTCS